MTLSSTSTAHLLLLLDRGRDKEKPPLGTVKDQPEPPSKITRTRCQRSGGTLSKIRCRQNVKHHPEHDTVWWAV